MSRYVPFRSILETVAEYYGVEVDDMLGSACRQRHISTPRHVAMWLARRLTLMSLEAIADAMLIGDHTSVMYAIQKVEKWHAKGDPATADLLHNLSPKETET